MESSLISGKTKICGVIGDPIEHTMSPVMHNAAFKKLGIDYLYVAFKVSKEELGRAVEGVRALNIRGLNVTIPHKVAIIPFLDKVDPLVEKIGAVNTIVNDGGVLTGYNTDATGFLQALLKQGVEPKGKNIVILGAGGASRAISFILAERGANLVILNRELELDWAEELARRISQVFNQEVKALLLNEDNLAKVLERADVVVNATSVGMSPNIDETPVPARLLKPGLIIFDIVYNPIKTKLLKEAEAAGAKTIGGLDMFVWQGALAFEKWTGQQAPFELMKREVIKRLSSNLSPCPLPLLREGGVGREG
ncbi:MAG: shikimate dehydrogenase [Dehalococcoidales bacterium]